MTSLDATGLNQNQQVLAGIYNLEPEAVYDALGSSDSGISESEAAERLRQYGENSIQLPKGKSLFSKLLANFTHMMALLLWSGGLLAFIASMPQLGIAIWLVNIINGLFSFMQEFRAEQATQALQKLLPQTVRVDRAGIEKSILATQLVPGDIILLSEGDNIPADARLVSDAELRVNESVLTGESEPVRKSFTAIDHDMTSAIDIPNFVFAGTNVVAGNGRAVVFATGMDRELGKIAHLTQSLPQDISPLQKEMQTVTKIITLMVILIGGFFFVMAITLGRVSLTDSAIFTLGMIVAFVPEGMLPTLTLSLAISSQRMARRNALIKRLSSVETLGCTTVICSDKTGTLTENEMTVRDIWLPASSSASKVGRHLSVTGTGYSTEGAITYEGQTCSLDQTTGLHELLQAVMLCNNSRLMASADDSAHWSALGDPTEAALLVAAEKGGLDLQTELKHAPRIDELPFDSNRKRMSTLHQVNNVQYPDVGTVALVKGSPLETLDLCKSLLQNGQVTPLDDKLRAMIKDANDQYARQGLRVLAVAYRQIHNLKKPTPANVERGLTFLGLIAMMDPPRPEVREAAKQCQTAGIRIIMITGDYGLTAASIAEQVGITHKNVRVVSGSDLETMDDDQLRKILNHEVIFARSSPQHKLRIVSALQSLGHIVAVTGDGVNDAPALKKADIGVAMGRNGTDVAKEAADMILTDDNFASIVSAVREGRAVYANIKKFVTYIFTSNAPEAVPFILYVLSRSSIPLALTVMQVIFIDLGTDMAPALALGAEPPEPDAMSRPPRNLKEHVVTRSLLIRSYLYLGVLQSAAALLAFFFMYWMHGYHSFLGLPHSGSLYRAATAMTLATVVSTQIGNLFAQRSERLSSFKIKAFSNRLIWIGISVELLLIFAVIYVPFLSHVFQTASLPLGYWLFIFAWMPLLLLADEVRKWVVRRRVLAG